MQVLKSAFSYIYSTVLHAGKEKGKKGNPTRARDDMMPGDRSDADIRSVLSARTMCAVRALLSHRIGNNQKLNQTKERHRSLGK